MIASELIAILVTDPSRKIILSRDEEGNGYGELAQVDTMSCQLEYRSNYEVGYDKLTPELEDQGYSEEDILDKPEPAFVLYP